MATNIIIDTEEIHVSGDELLAKVKALIDEGSARRIIIKNAEGRTLIEIPLTLGIVAAAIMPVLAAVGALAAVVAHLTIVVVKRETDEEVELEEADRGTAP